MSDATFVTPDLPTVSNDLSGEIMSLRVLGVNHRTAPLEVRECYAHGPHEVPISLERVLATGARGGVLLSKRSSGCSGWSGGMRRSTLVTGGATYVGSVQGRLATGTPSTGPFCPAASHKAAP